MRIRSSCVAVIVVAAVATFAACGGQRPVQPQPGGPQPPGPAADPLPPPAGPASSLTGSWVASGYRQSSAWTEGVVLDLDADGTLRPGRARMLTGEPEITDVAFCDGACGGAAYCDLRCSLAGSWSATSETAITFGTHCTDGRARTMTYALTALDDARPARRVRAALRGVDDTSAAGWCTIVHVGLNYLSLARCDGAEDCADTLSQATELP